MNGDIRYLIAKINSKDLVSISTLCRQFKVASHVIEKEAELAGIPIIRLPNPVEKLFAKDIEDLLFDKMYLMKTDKKWVQSRLKKR